MPDSLRFLVVDPLSGVQTFARQLLHSHGFAADNVLCCADTEAALAQGLLFKPHFLLTDWFARAPVTGPALCRRLREARPALHVALLSFDVRPDHEQEARALGAHFLLKKPFTADQLKDEVTRALAALARHTPGLHGPLRDAMREGLREAVRGPRAVPRPPRPARPALPRIPPLPVLKPGDRVRYAGATHVAECVVHRHGDTVVQLKGQSAFVPLDKLQPA